MKTGLSRVVIGIFVFWLLVLLYMSTSLYSGESAVERTERQLSRALEELDVLKKQNDQLQSLANELKDLRNLIGKPESEVVNSLTEQLAEAKEREKKLLNEKKYEKQNIVGKQGEPGSDHENIRRKVYNGVVELWYYLKSELSKIKDTVRENTDATSKINEVLEDGAEQQRSILTDIYNLSIVNGAEEWRRQEAHELGNLIQKRLYKLQNPKDCSKAKKIVCNINKGCGYGCQLHHIVYCFIVAYGSQRTMILESNGWRYSAGGWDKVFKPVSDTCVSRSGHSSRMWGPPDAISDVQVVDLPIVDSLHPRPAHMPPAIPEDIAPRLSRLHGHPVVWWIGQFLKYLLRPQPELEKDLKETEVRLGFQHPIVGVHVRRTDKVGTEAAFHSIDEYMVHVEQYYKLLSRRKKIDQKRVYLATDDPNLLAEAKKKYDKYIFVSDNEFSRSAGLGTRYSDSSLRGIIMDIHFLAKSDYLVCTFSSQVCRVAYEIMQTMWPDASTAFHSLDDIYYYGGQSAHQQIAIYKHEPRSHSELELMPGDPVGVAGNHWDGYSKGTNKKTGRSGLYPSYKVVDQVDVAKFPVYRDDENS